MKKIISIILALACAFTLFSCDDEVNPNDAAIKEIIDMYNAISPSMVTTETTQTFGKYTLTSKATLKVGTVDGYAVAVYEYANQKLRTVEDGAGVDILDPIETVTGIREYHENFGYRENGGKWDVEGEDFTPATGAIALNITSDTVSDFSSDEATKTVSFKVKAENTKAVLGIEIASEVEVTITHSGADIIGVTLSYTEAEPDNDDYPEVQVTIKASYSYESQVITIK